MKRLAVLDSMRGFAVLGMVELHIGYLASMLGLIGSGGSSFFKVPPPSTYDLPLATGIFFFFFVTGISLAVSIARRSEKGSFSTMARRVVLRYGGYYLSAIIVELILLYSFIWMGLPQPTNIMIILGGAASYFSAVQGLGIAAILAFPLILFLPWKKLLTASIGVALVVGLVLYLILFFKVPLYWVPPNLFIVPLNPFLTGYFSALKGLSVILLGATVGKLIVEGRDIKKKIILIGAPISLGYTIVPAILNSGLQHLMAPIWSYPHAIPFICGSCLFLLGLFQILEARNHSLSPLRVLGRLSLTVFYAHFLILLPILYTLKLLKIDITFGLLIGFVVLTEIIVWIAAYFYSKWRWGSPSSW